MSAEEIVAGAGAEGQRLDRFVCDRLPKLGRAAARRLIELGSVQVNGRRAAAGQRLSAGDRVALAQLPESAAAIADASLSLTVVYEDAWLVVVEKPAGVPSHPLRAGERGTLAQALLARYPELAGVGYSVREPGIVHRLDTNTSGLMLAARDQATFAALRTQLERAAIDKRYLALCAGQLEAPALHEAWLLARGPRVTVRAAAFTGATRIDTELLSARQLAAFTLVNMRARHARRHQLRAHLALLGHPIAGDLLYGGAALPGLERHFLHASELHFTHPQTGATVALVSALPAELEAVITQVSA